MSARVPRDARAEGGAERRRERAEQYEQLLQLADLLDDAGTTVRSWATLGRRITDAPEVVASVPYSPETWQSAEDELRALGSGRSGLMSRSVELDADALVLRATVLTYRWIDDLQDVAYRTLGSVAGRAIGYLAPRVDLGGSIVAAGLVETDVADRDDVAAYLGELAESDPDLMEHLTTGGGLLESLQLRALLTAGAPEGAEGRAARRGGLRAAGVEALEGTWAAALRDVAEDLDTAALPAHPPATTSASPEGVAPPAGLADLMGLMGLLAADGEPLRILRTAPGRLLVLVDEVGRALPGGGRLRLVTGGSGGEEDVVLAALREAADLEGGAVRVMLVGRGTGGETAVRVASALDSGATGASAIAVDQVVVAGAPAVHLAPTPGSARRVQVLSLDERTDPVALLGSLVNAGTSDRLSVVYDAEDHPDVPPLVAGGRAADLAEDPLLRAVLERWRRWGYLRPTG